MRELSLFSGAGGGLLATKHLLGWTTVGYVEWDDYCQRVLRARIDDGLLDDAPIFGDIRTFINEGYAAAYTGMVDVVTGGFPCQPFSFAGKQAGADDPRNMWPATIGCVRVVRPRYCFFENVPGLLNSGYFPTILGDLAESGFDVRWRVLSAAELGAPHRRDRLWIVADAGSKRWHHEMVRNGHGEKRARRDTSKRGGHRLLAKIRPKVRTIPNTRWPDPPAIVGVVDELAHVVDRLKALGNGQVPAVAAAAWHLLTEDIMGGVIGG